MRLSDRCYAVTGLSYKFPPVVNAGFIVGDQDLQRNHRLHGIAIALISYAPCA